MSNRRSGAIAAAVGALVFCPVVLVGAIAGAVTPAPPVCPVTSTVPPQAGALTGVQVATAAVQAGFTGPDLVTAVAVARAESGWDPMALNPSGAAGLWQILRSAHPDLFARYTWTDPAQNALMAYAVWLGAPGGGRNWTPWVAYASGAYAQYLPEAQAAVAGLGGAKPPGPTCPVSPIGSARGLAVVQAAITQLGVPYSWGSESPGQAFDCSGLTAWAYGTVGVSLPHNAAAQAAMMPHYPLAQAQAGDLLFFDSPIGHVGIYVSPGQMIDAPHTGAVVRYDDYTGWPGLQPYVGRPS